MPRTPLPKAIATLRGKRTRAAFARDVGVPRGYPKRWEVDGITPSTAHLQLLVSAGLDRAYLLGPLADAQGKGGRAAS